VGRYPLHHGSVGVVRTLGRTGVRVYAVVEDAFTPTARSRYLCERFVWPTSGAEDPCELVTGILAIGERIGCRAILVPTDDEAALLVAEHAHLLRERFLLPDVAPALPRRLASKHGLAELCAEAGVATPVCVRPRSVAELLEAAGKLGFPVVLKNDGRWERLAAPAVAATTVVRDVTELERLASSWRSMPSVVLQEYLPHERTEDWSVHVYCGREPGCVLAFTGRKLRSYPPHAGVTAVGLTAANEELRDLAVGFCRAVGFRGVAGMDWRLDARDGRYKLLDFNVRLGAKFRMFETDQGVDVVRALHLDMTGRPVPLGREIADRRFVVGNLALAAAGGYRRERRTGLPIRRAPAGGVERAWLAADDPLPGLLVAMRSIALAYRPLKSTFTGGVGASRTRTAR
jgi:D-aspartate ligase